MRILAIETSCDETAISIVEAKDGLETPSFDVLAHLVSSQTKIHAPWGGVVPNLAKREHQKNLIPILRQALTKFKKVKKLSSDRKEKIADWPPRKIADVKKILAREPELLARFLKFIPTITAPPIDALAVTRGPGLEPALWVGINFAKALALVWQKPLVPVNHLEGHIYSVLIPTINHKLKPKISISFPALALLVSGGHTELILIKNWLEHKTIGQTLDDAAGECFDKVARLLGLPYPGGPAIAKLAKQFSNETSARGATPAVGQGPASGWKTYSLPRPMLHSPDFNFSFSGLKTAALYLVKKESPLNQAQRAALAYECQQAIVETLVKKTAKALIKLKPRTLIVTGGVAANQELKRQMKKMITTLSPELADCQLLISNSQLSTDNATMIAVAAHLHLQKKKKISKNFSADGNLKLD